MKTRRLAGAVLAGGRSRRLGRDKSKESLGGKRLIDRAVLALRPHTGEVVVVSSRPETPTGWWTVIEDARPSCGPLGGIEAALRFAREGGYHAVVVLAVDLPLVDGPAIHVLVDAFAADPARPAAAARLGDPDFEPLCAVYPVACLESVIDLLDRGERAARGLFVATGGVRVEGVGGADLNVNEATDLVEARARIRRGRTGDSA